MSPLDTQSKSLRDIRLLSDVPNQRLEQVEAACQWRTYAPNEMIFELDDKGTDIYFVVSGKLRIMIFGQVSDEDGAAPQESSVTLAEMSSGDTFGEMSAIDGNSRSARALAMDKCVLATLNREAFIDLMEDCPRVAIALLMRLTSLIRSLNKRVQSLSTLTPMQRIYGELVRLAEPNPQGDGSWVINNLPPHGDIASWAGADRENVATAIGQLAREGVVERRHRSLVVRNHQRLRMLAHL